MLRTARTAHSAWRILLPEETLGRLKINPYGSNKLFSQQVTMMCIFLQTTDKDSTAFELVIV